MNALAGWLACLLVGHLFVGLHRPLRIYEGRGGEDEGYVQYKLALESIWYTAKLRSPRPHPPPLNIPPLTSVVNELYSFVRCPRLALVLVLWPMVQFYNM